MSTSQKVLCFGGGLLLLWGLLFALTKSEILAIRIMFVLLVVVGIGFVIEKYVWVRVGEQETAVIYNRETKSFVRFAGHGRVFLLPWIHYIGGIISTAITSTRGICRNALTRDGIYITANWSVSGRWQPESIAIEWRPDLARALPTYGDNLLRKHINNCLQQFVNEMTSGQLFQQGARRGLERALRDRINERLRPFGFQVYRIMIEEIIFPLNVQKSLEAALERETYTQSEIQSLEQFQKLISQFSEKDINAMILIKQIYEMSKNGVSLLIPNTIIQNNPNRGDNHTGTKAPPPKPKENPPDEHSDWPSVHH